jgi:hypothetical protein
MVSSAIPRDVTMSRESPTRRNAPDVLRLREDLRGVALEEDEGQEGE